MTAQLGRAPRGVRAVAHRCRCGLPDVVETRARLEDGTPFPTLYYLTCPRARSAVGRLEASGLMREMTARLVGDAELSAAYRQAHEEYIRRRDGVVSAAPEDHSGEIDISSTSAGGMPDRVKCLHVLVAYQLAAPGATPFGQEALDLLVGPAGPPGTGEPAAWGGTGPCVAVMVAAGTP